MRSFSRTYSPLILVLTASVVFACGQVAANGVELPGVLLAFDLNARDFNATLSPAAKQEVADSVVAVLGSNLSSYFCYVSWQTDSATAADTGSANVLTVAIVGEDRPGGMGQRVYIEFRTQLASNSALLQEARRPVLYESYAVQPTQDRDRFIADISDSLTALVGESEFRHTLEDQFLSRIPVAKDIRVEIPLRCVIVPLSWDALCIDEGSRFKAEWQYEIAGSEVPLGGNLLMESQSSYAGDILCRLLQFQCPPIDVDASPAWHDSIPVMLDRIIEGTLVIYLREYRRNPFPNERNGLSWRVDR